MRRIAPRNEVPDHDVEIHYLNQLSGDLKLWFHGYEPRRPLDLERIYRWRYIYSSELNRCSGFNMREYDDLGRRKVSVERGHDTAIKYFNALIADFETILKDEEPNTPITDDRLDEATLHIRNISKCQHPRIYY